MTRVGIRKLKNGLSRYLARVRKGQTIMVTDRGETVAMMVPAPASAPKQRTLDEILQEMAAAGHIRLAMAGGKLRPFKPIRGKGKPLSQMIVEDRQ